VASFVVEQKRFDAENMLLLGSFDMFLTGYDRRVHIRASSEDGISKAVKGGAEEGFHARALFLIVTRLFACICISVWKAFQHRYDTHYYLHIRPFGTKFCYEPITYSESCMGLVLDASVLNVAVP
jgi:hypothetical protein